MGGKSWESPPGAGKGAGKGHLQTNQGVSPGDALNLIMHKHEQEQADRLSTDQAKKQTHHRQ
eukprot:2547122-Heterocapsa_arctica.AAC.1